MPFRLEWTLACCAETDRTCCPGRVNLGLSAPGATVRSKAPEWAGMTGGSLTIPDAVRRNPNGLP